MVRYIFINTSKNRELQDTSQLSQLTKAQTFATLRLCEKQKFNKVLIWNKKLSH